MAEILVFGHRNPDNDSVSSAVAYAYLKNATDPDDTYIPARLGPMPKETTWVFERYGIEMPRALSHVRNRVVDVMTSPAVTVPCDTTLLEAGRILNAHDFGALMVDGPDGEFAGMLTMRQFANRLLQTTEVDESSTVQVRLSNLARCIEGEIVIGDPEMKLSSRMVIAASEPATAAAAIHPGDTVILGDRRRTQPLAIQAGAACIILTCGAYPAREVVTMAEDFGTALLTSPLDTYAVARLFSLAPEIDAFVDSAVDTCSPDDLLADVAATVLPGSYREAAVLDGRRRCIGVVTRGDIARAKRRKVILVDHNEAAQSAVGIEEAEVCEIVDHHRVADIQTASPILFMNYPLGSTATIVAQRYLQLGVEIPAPMAAALLSAMMTDTMLLKSPTTTQFDREMATRLADIIGVEAIPFGIDVIRSRGGDANASAAEIIGTDAKVYSIGDDTVCIAQHETFDLAGVLAREAEIERAMAKASAENGYDVFLLLVTDVIEEGSQFVCTGRVQLVERAFDISLSDGSVFMPGILSRKKQVVGSLFDRGA